MLSKILCLLIFLPFTNNLIVNIGATGLLLPYTLGVLGYIKSHTNINKNNSKFIGTSGGAYCCLLYKYEKNLTDHDYIWENIFGLNKKTKIDLYNIDKFQTKSIQILLDRYKNKKINKKDNINIIATKYNNILNNEIVVFDNFNNISDLIYKCYCSSYIPYISGNKLYYNYSNVFSRR